MLVCDYVDVVRQSLGIESLPELFECSRTPLVDTDEKDVELILVASGLCFCVRFAVHLLHDIETVFPAVPFVEGRNRHTAPVQPVAVFPLAVSVAVYR